MKSAPLTVAAAKIAKIQAFAAFGGSTPDETTHVRKLAARVSESSNPKKSFPAQEPAWQTAWAWTSSSAPAIPTHPWTDAETKKAEELLTGADWPLFDAATGIYERVKKCGYKRIPQDSLVSEARLLQLALLLSMQEGHFRRLDEVLQLGQKGMETFIIADYYEDKRMEAYYEKTAGDMSQSYWCRKHLSDMSDCFGANPIQASIARWLQLPRLVLPRSIADHVSKWFEHPMADFQVQLTLYLPTELLALYLSISTGYYKLFVQSVGEVKRCEHRNHRGLLCCDKQVHKHYGRFCSFTHHSDTRHRVLKDFDAVEYGAEYMQLAQGDMVTILQHSESGGGWSYAKHLERGTSGWIPTEFTAPQ